MLNGARLMDGQQSIPALKSTKVHTAAKINDWDGSQNPIIGVYRLVKMVQIVTDKEPTAGQD